MIQPTHAHTATDRLEGIYSHLLSQVRLLHQHGKHEPSAAIILSRDQVHDLLVLFTNMGLQPGNPNLCARPALTFPFISGVN